MKIEATITDDTAPESRSACDEPEISDAALVSRALHGDRGAFEILVLRHQAALFRRARWMGVDAEAAADMVQDSLIKAYNNLASCREPDKFGSWVGQILRNRCLDLLKSAARRSVPLPDLLPAEHGDPEREEQRNTVRRRLNAALATLPDEQREAFLMKHAEGMSYEEMAQLAHASVSAMKMRVHRAIEALRDQLGVVEVRS